MSDNNFPEFKYNRFDLLGIPADPLETEEIIRALNYAVAHDAQITLCNINLHGLYCAQKSDHMAKLLKRDDSLVHIDGMPIVWLGRLKGRLLSSKTRNTHIDLVPVIIKHFAARGWPIGFICSAPEFRDDNVEALKSIDTGGSYCVEHGHLSSDVNRFEETERIIKRMNQAGCKIVFVGMGMPLQEEWILQNRHLLTCTVVMPVGGFIDYFAGRTATPPRVLGKLGLEGVYRFLRDPRRLAFRYIVEPLLLLKIWLYYEFRKTKDRS